MQTHTNCAADSRQPALPVCINEMFVNQPQRTRLAGFLGAVHTPCGHHSADVLFLVRELRASGLAHPLPPRRCRLSARGCQAGTLRQQTYTVRCLVCTVHAQLAVDAADVVSLCVSGCLMCNDCPPDYCIVVLKWVSCNILLLSCSCRLLAMLADYL